MAPTKRNAKPNSLPQTKRALQTTLRLPDSLYQQARKLVSLHKHADSMNDLIIAALTAYLKAVDRTMIDRAFAGMADDPEYREEAALIAKEFAASDAEATILADSQFATQK